MKTLHLAIISAGTILVVGVTVIFAILMVPRQSDIDITIEGLKDTYEMGKQFSFHVKVNGYGSFCGDPAVEIFKTTNRSEIVWTYGGNEFIGINCPERDLDLTFGFRNISINQTGSYIVSINNKMGKEFYVIPQERYFGLTDEQVMDIKHAKLGCAKIGNKTACDEMIQQKINFYKELNENPCSQLYPNGLDTFQQPFSQTSPKRLVFFMEQSSAIKICVRYTSDLDNIGLQEVYAYMWVGKINFEQAPESEIIVTSYPSHVPLSLGSNTTVVYTVTSINNSKGVYWIGLPQVCELIPIVVGLDSSQVASSEIPVHLGFGSCPAISLNAQIVGVSDANVEYKVAQPIGEP